MHDYEVTFIINPNLGDDEVTALTERVTTIITNAGGEIVDVHPWGKRRLAYPIQRHRDGHYVTTRFRATGGAEQGLYSQIKLNESIIRHGVYRMDDMIAAAK